MLLLKKFACVCTWSCEYMSIHAMTHWVSVSPSTLLDTGSHVGCPCVWQVTWQPVSSLRFSCSVFHCPRGDEITQALTMQLYVGSGDLNSGPCSCTAIDFQLSYPRPLTLLHHRGLYSRRKVGLYYVAGWMSRLLWERQENHLTSDDTTWWLSLMLPAFPSCPRHSSQHCRSCLTHHQQRPLHRLPTRLGVSLALLSTK